MKRFVAMLLAAALTGCGTAGGSVPPPAAQPEPPAIQSAVPEETVPAAPPHEAELSAPEGDVVEITERLFIAQTNDIYLNAGDYLGKAVKYEGIFKETYWPDTDETFRFVIRYGPGCCGYDGEAGFEVAWDGPWPRADDWCEAVGVLEEYEQGGFRYLRLALTSLTVLEERGAEYVNT